MHSGHGRQRRRCLRRRIAALAVGLLALAATPCGVARDAYPAPPQRLFKDLFTAVQSAAIFPDSKTFADAVPNAPSADILAQYHAVHPANPQALRRFAEAHFSLPSQVGAALSAPARVPIVEHIDALWDQLTRSTTNGTTLWVAAAATAAVRGPGRPLSGNLLLGFVFHDARSGSERASRSGSGHGA